MTKTYQFGGMLYDTERQYYDAIASEWLSAGGLNDGGVDAEILAAQTDESLADECLDGWQGEIDRDNLIAAFGRLRATMEGKMAAARDYASKCFEETRADAVDYGVEDGFDSATEWAEHEMDGDAFDMAGRLGITPEQMRAVLIAAYTPDGEFYR